MSDNANYSGDIAALFRKLAPPVIDVKSVERNDGFSVTLAYESMESSFLIPKIDLISNIENTIRNRICIFSQKIGDEVEKQLSLESYFKEKYADRNIIYKVPRNYEVELSPRATIAKNLVLFFGDEVKKIVPNYESLLRWCLDKTFHHENIEVLEEFLNGAFERLKQVLFAKEIIDDLSGKVEQAGKMDNDILFLINFHVYYFITLIRALGDNLAWILNYYYKMNLETDPKQIDLRMTKFKNALKDALKGENEELFLRICQGSGYESYCDLKKFREIVVHRHALHIVPVFFIRSLKPPIVVEKLKIMVPTKPATGALADELGNSRKTSTGVRSVRREDTRSITRYGLFEAVYSALSQEELRKSRKYEEIVFFCQKHLNFIIDAYNEAINRMLKEIRLTR